MLQGALTAQPNLPLRGEPCSAAPGLQPDLGAPDAQHFLPICFRSVLTVRMPSRLLSHSLPLSFSLSPSPISLPSLSESLQ